VILYEEKLIDLKNNYVCEHIPFHTLLETEDNLSKINKLRLAVILIRFILPLFCFMLAMLACFTKGPDKKMVLFDIFLGIVTVD